MQIALWCLGAYLLIGVCVTIYFYEPEQDGLLWQVLMWPGILIVPFLNPKE